MFHVILKLCVVNDKSFELHLIHQSRVTETIINATAILATHIL